MKEDKVINKSFFLTEDEHDQDEVVCPVAADQIVKLIEEKTTQ
jgi:hypothetical protein